MGRVQVHRDTASRHARDAAEQLSAQLSAYEPDSVTTNNAVSIATERRADVVRVASSVTTA